MFTFLFWSTECNSNNSQNLQWARFGEINMQWLGQNLLRLGGWTRARHITRCDLFPLWSKYIWFVYYELNNQWLKQTQKDLNRLSLSASFSFNAVNVFFIFCQSWILLSDEQILLLCTSLSFISSLCIKRFPGYIMQMIWGGRRHFDLTLFHVIDTNRQSIWQSSWSSYGICTRRTSLVWGGVDAENPTPVSPY